jgi:hypothetical protein
MASFWKENQLVHTTTTKKTLRTAHGLENQCVSAAQGCSFLLLFSLFLIVFKPLLLKFCEDGIHVMD